MGSGNIVVGDKPSVPRSTQAVSIRTVAGLAERAGAKVAQAAAPVGAKGDQPRNCGAMSQQRCDTGMESTPQKFLHLVGHREPRTEPKT